MLCVPPPVKEKRKISLCVGLVAAYERCRVESTHVTVGEIEASDIHAGVDELGQVFNIPTCWTERAHNFGPISNHIHIFSVRNGLPLHYSSFKPPE